MDGLREAVPASVWRRWRRYEALEPFGPRQEEVRAAVLAVMTAAPHRKANAAPLKLSTFFPSLAEEDGGRAEVEEADLIQARWKVWVLAQGGTVEEGK